MISVSLRRNTNGDVYGYSVIGHADASVVCPSVSLFAINTANAIKTLTDEPLNYGRNPDGGFLQIELPRMKSGHRNNEANLLLESMVLGLQLIKEKYSDEIEIVDIRDAE